MMNILNKIALLRSEDLILSASLTQDFCSSSRRRNRRIAGYATVFTTQKTDKKTSQEADIIKSSLLTSQVARKLPLAIVLLTLLTSAQAGEYEKPPALAAKAIFPDIPLKGKHYTIEASVPTDGFLTRTVINSEFGKFVALGPGMLEIRLNEIEALAKLKTFEASEEFKRGAKASAESKMGGLQQIYDKPKETVAGISSGVSSFFKRSYRAAKTGVQTVNDVIQEQSPGSTGEPGPGAKLPGQAESQTISNSSSKYEKAAKASGSAAINILGYSDSRRKLAKRLGVDPYTTNKILGDKLDAVTWSIFAGDFGVDVVTSLIPGSMVISSSSTISKWVWDIAPGDLRVKIEQTLLDLNISQDQVDRLLRHRSYPLSYQAILTVALDELSKVDGYKDVLPLALSVETVDQARFLVNSMRMLKHYHATVVPLKSIAVKGSVFATNEKGSIIIAAPVDYVSWTAVLDKFSGISEFSSTGHEIHIAGSMSAMAKAQLQKRGWLLYENSALYTRMTADE